MAAAAGWTAGEDVDPGWQGGILIDDLETVVKLMERMKTALPMRARVGSEVLRMLRRETPDDAPTSQRCEVTEVHYTEDEGGILCSL
ncbi:MAG: hypothetical protein QF491_01500, partial [Alphaproteobacteria bacterium]|nr:hypothetical protein [Alphaproteobacteria bacterium]